jgi:hypothetical protein
MFFQIELNGHFSALFIRDELNSVHDSIVRQETLTR